MKAQYRLFIALFAMGFAYHSGIAQYGIQHSTIGSGGGMVSGGGIYSTVTVGQLVVGPSYNESNAVYAGFWNTVYTPVVTSVDLTDETRLPFEYRLEQNYPNPFNPATNIQFAVPERAGIRLAVYNVLGQLVATLADGEFDAGYHTIRFDASSLPSGMYIYRLTAQDTNGDEQRIFVRRMMLVQ